MTRRRERADLRAARWPLRAGGRCPGQTGSAKSSRTPPWGRCCSRGADVGRVADPRAGRRPTPSGSSDNYSNWDPAAMPRRRLTTSRPRRQGACGRWPGRRASAPAGCWRGWWRWGWNPSSSAGNALCPSRSGSPLRPIPPRRNGRDRRWVAWSLAAEAAPVPLGRYSRATATPPYRPDAGSGDRRRRSFPADGVGENRTRSSSRQLVQGFRYV